MLETLLSFTISLLIGLLIGIERERSHPEGTQFIGVRTFTMLSILGTLIAALNQVGLTITASAFVFGMLLLNYFRSTSNVERNLDIGIVTEITAGITFCLGYMVPTSPLVTVTVSAIILLVLIERKRLHALARKKFKPYEIEAAIVVIIFTMGVLPLLPNRTIDPWQFFNPRNFGLLLTTIAVIQFGGYVAIHLFGERLGIAFTGFLGGLVSSTAVFSQLPDTLKKHSEFTIAIMASCILATIATLVDVIIIIFVASPSLLLAILFPITSMVVVGALFAIILLYYQKAMIVNPSPLSNPISLTSIIRTSFFIGLMLILIAIAKRFISIKSILWISFLGGAFQIQGISLATALLYLENQLNSHDVRLMIYIAIVASFVSKFAMLWVFTPIRFAFQTSLFLFGILSCGGFVYWSCM
jgi:uncharacterized membrane protein (DUF4010 family)